MDIEYLLLLQRFRNSINDALTPFMEAVSLFAVTYIFLLPAFLYWVDKKGNGLYILSSHALCISMNAVLKLTACVYRPWIRDARVLPAGDAIRTATGYSFPSGHTTYSGPIYGAMAVNEWKRKRYRFISVILVIMILLTGFSRNYLGVHTPQDVFVGIFETVLYLIIVSRIFRYVGEHPEKEDMFLISGFVLGWIAIAYITFKSYPMTYVDGKLLVDPAKMMIDGYGDISYLISLCFVRFIGKRLVKHEPLGWNIKGVVLAVIGLIPLWAMIGHLKPVLDGWLGSNWGHFLYTFVLIFYTVLLYPAVLGLFRKKSA